ncbi:MAG: hypothetical protein DMF89_12440 [Acidobacteria bacterium]|nr:MAG: hypothetical protein DMF89_12440 [Acidobacteriota bacterium]
MTSTSHAPIVVIGGGIAGLTAAALLGRTGAPVVLVEKTSALGGRAATRDRSGFLFNLGPHALYRAGALRKTLTSLGVDVRGGVPTSNGGYAIRGGRRHTLPAGFASLLTTGLLTLSGKLEFARFQSRLAHLDTAAIADETLASWLTSNVGDAILPQVLQMLVRVTTFTNDPERQSAGAALDQLQLGVRAGVLYVDGGWQTIVDGLRGVALASGVRIISGAHAVALERARAGDVDAVRLADGSAVRASGVIIAAGPADVDALAGTRFATDTPSPIRVATLDVALRSLPQPRATVAFGVDTPVYFSVHSAIAKLAPDGGAMIHVSKYMWPGEVAGHGDEVELETVMEMMQPGWRDLVVAKQYLPSLTVTHAGITAAQGGLTGRPPSRAATFDNVWIAGDWVGPRGQLSDASAASASEAARLAADLAVRPHGRRAVSPTVRMAERAS